MKRINAKSPVAVHTHTHIWFISEDKKNEYIVRETYKTYT